MDEVSAHIFHANAVKIRGFGALVGSGVHGCGDLLGMEHLNWVSRDGGALKDGEERKLEELNEQKHGVGQGEQSRIS